MQQETTELYIELCITDGVVPAYITLAYMRVLAWRQGTPLDQTQSKIEFNIDVADGDSYYARVAWTDGNLAWTSPIRIRLDKEEH